MKILITGGAGFIGSHVADAYLEAGHEVVIVDDLSSGKAEHVNPAATFYNLDICSLDIERVFISERPDIVNHHAAQVSVPRSIEDPLKDAETNLKGTLNILQHCVKYNIKKVIFSSSGGAIYGNAEEYPTTENYIPQPLSIYAIDKFTAEHYLKFFLYQYGLQYTILRYANVYGPRQDSDGEAGVVAIFIKKLLAGDIPIINAYPDAPEGMIRDYVYVLDVVRANMAALSQGENNVFNIGTCVETTTSFLYKTILWHLQKSINPDYGPARKGDLRRSMLDSSKAFKELGWSPIYTLDKGIEETIAYHFKKGTD
jgi:UDP-glucose 4-epimerase